MLDELSLKIAARSDDYGNGEHIVNPQYGLTWWLASGDGDVDAADGGDPARRRPQAGQIQAIAMPDGTPAKVYMAAGLGKQRLIVMPDQKLVIVRYAESIREGQQYSDAKLIELLMGWAPVPRPDQP